MNKKALSLTLIFLMINCLICQIRNLEALSMNDYYPEDGELREFHFELTNYTYYSLGRYWGFGCEVSYETYFKAEVTVSIDSDSTSAVVVTFEIYNGVIKESSIKLNPNETYNGVFTKLSPRRNSGLGIYINVDRSEESGNATGTIDILTIHQGFDWYFTRVILPTVLTITTTIIVSIIVLFITSYRRKKLQVVK